MLSDMNKRDEASFYGLRDNTDIVNLNCSLNPNAAHFIESETRAP